MNLTPRAQVYRTRKAARTRRSRFERGRGWTYIAPEETVTGQMVSVLSQYPRTNWTLGEVSRWVANRALEINAAVTPYPAPKPKWDGPVPSTEGWLLMNDAGRAAWAERGVYPTAPKERP